MLEGKIANFDKECINIEKAKQRISNSLTGN